MKTERTTPFSVIIPAHNEEATIARCLKALYDDAPAAALPEVLVVCNGCTDRTEEIARQVAPHATVISLETGSKPLALNTGNERAKALPRFFVDADISVDYRSLAATAKVLAEPGIMAAAPALFVDTTACSWPVRTYYAVWTSQPYVLDGMIGSGVMGLSEEGLRVVGSFPHIIADDEYVRTRFPSAQRRRVAEDDTGKPVYLTMSPPRNLASLIRIESRQRAGMAQLKRLLGNAQTDSRMTGGGSLLRTIGQDNSLFDIALYLAVKVAGRIRYRWSRMRGTQQLWLRDESSRQAPPVV